MTERAAAAGSRAARRLFLAPESTRAKPLLLDGEADHALRVLRLEAGDSVDGLDGSGGLWPLQITRAARRDIDLTPAGEPRFEPRAGEAGAALPWIECAVALPRGERAESMADQLTQLGIAEISPLDAERGTPQSRSEGSLRRDRLLRILRAACKQSGRLWLPTLAPVRALAGLLDEPRERDVVALSPTGSVRISGWLRDRTRTGGADGEHRWTRERPLTLVVGPEGGFTDAEHRALDARGATFVTLGPHVLRVETAAVAAVAVLVEALHAARATEGKKR